MLLPIFWAFLALFRAEYNEPITYDASTFSFFGFDDSIILLSDS